MTTNIVARPNQPQHGSLSESDTITRDQSASYRIPRDTYSTYFNVLGICILLGVYGVNYSKTSEQRILWGRDICPL